MEVEDEDLPLNQLWREMQENLDNHLRDNPPYRFEQEGQHQFLRFHFDMMPAHPNERVALRTLRDRILDIIYANTEKDAQAVDISKATFETLCELLHNRARIDCLFGEDFVSNLFGPYLNKQAFYNKLEEFDAATWRVDVAQYQIDDMIVGNAGFSASDQQICFSLKYVAADRHFKFMFLNRNRAGSQSLQQMN